MNKLLLPLLAAAILSGCASSPIIDRSISAKSQDSRVKFLIVHYTQGNFVNALKTLSQGDVSSHYLVDDSSGKIYGLVDEARRAYHAGVSSWKGQNQLNYSSVGIEIVNSGPAKTPEGIVWQEYPAQQITNLIWLMKQIVARHEIKPENILGHSDIAPQRKIDPGPSFPWHRLADEGLGVWPDANRVAAMKAVFDAQLPVLAWFQQKLAQFGYEVPQSTELDEPTRRVVAAFQMHFRPSRYDGIPDAETAAILEVLTSPSDPTGGQAVK
ncbi:MAG: N-acetylmuramoyl-L-alanine amidase [Betaproteobacteria bacterium]|nr:N-acetylmuramoyl-L-alanine amidase [Betaproteobacteria bacterium]